MILNYINGEFVKAQSGKTETLINPATEEVIDEITEPVKPKRARKTTSDSAKAGVKTGAKSVAKTKTTRHTKGARSAKKD